MSETKKGALEDLVDGGTSKLGPGRAWAALGGERHSHSQLLRALSEDSQNETGSYLREWAAHQVREINFFLGQQSLLFNTFFVCCTIPQKVYLCCLIWDCFMPTVWLIHLRSRAEPLPRRSWKLLESKRHIPTSWLSGHWAGVVIVWNALLAVMHDWINYNCWYEPVEAMKPLLGKPLICLKHNWYRPFKVQAFISPLIHKWLLHPD